LGFNKHQKLGNVRVMTVVGIKAPLVDPPPTWPVPLVTELVELLGWVDWVLELELELVLVLVLVPALVAVPATELGWVDWVLPPAPALLPDPEP
jgi:hypothetical protein